jgi:DNA-binding CsgD family transcriptional regulator
LEEVNSISASSIQYRRSIPSIFVLLSANLDLDCRLVCQRRSGEHAVSVQDNEADRRETELLSSLIGDIYDTTLDRSRWPATLKKIAAFVRGESAAVFWDDAASGGGDIYFEDGGIDPAYRDLYFEKFVKCNPITTPRFFAQTEVPVATADLVPYDEFLTTRFYREWAQPQGLVDFASITLEKSVTKSAMFGVFRHQRHGLVDDEMRRRMLLLGPHIRRAVLIAKVFNIKEAEAAMFSQSLDGLRAAIFFVDANGRIVHANAAGHFLVSEADVLRAAAGKLVAGEAESDAGLQDAFLVAATGDAAIGGTGIALPLIGKKGERHVAHVLPLTSGARQRARPSHAASAAVFVHKSAGEAPSPPEVIATAYKLTMAELRVLLAIVDVGGVPEVAEVLGIAATTVRTHLGNVFAKTGTNRQADLVKLVAGFANPLMK